MINLLINETSEASTAFVWTAKKTKMESGTGLVGSVAVKEESDFSKDTAVLCCAG